MLHSSLRNAIAILVLAGNALAATSFVDNVTFIGSQGSTNYYELASVQAELWTPADLPTNSLIGWFDASDASTVTQSSGNVSAWADKSVNNYTMTQGGGNKPEWGLGAQINGMNVMHYSGTFDELFNSGLSVSCTNACIISVGEAQPAGDYPAFGAMLKTDETDRVEARGQCQPTQGRTSGTVKIAGSNVAMVSPYDATLAEGTPFLFATWYDGDIGVSRANGGLVGDTANTTDDATLTINRIQVGRESNTPKNYQGEVVFLSVADTPTIELVEGYMAWKWGTEGNLDISHPYKFAAPTK